MTTATLMFCLFVVLCCVVSVYESSCRDCEREDEIVSAPYSLFNSFIFFIFYYSFKIIQDIFTQFPSKSFYLFLLH